MNDKKTVQNFDLIAAIKKQWLQLRYVLGLCVLLLVLFNIDIFIAAIFEFVFYIPYDGLLFDIAEIIIQAACFIVVIYVGLKDQQKTLASVCFFKKVNGKVWGAAILCFIGSVLFYFYLNNLFYSFKYGWYTDYELEGGNFLINLIYSALIPAVVEEILFKGLVFTILKKHYSTVLAVIIASLMFAACHLSFIRLIPLFLSSCFTFWVYLRSGSLVLPMMEHFINNLFTFVLISEPFASLGTFYSALALLAIGTYMLYRLSAIKKVTQ
jgi:membrane protease YdiL (CAAX protease family)